jgi:DNA-binding GntR family transcriptional regulator
MTDATPGIPQRRKLPSDVMASLREAIVSRRLAPGARLTEESLAREHGVSRVPVREALRSLEAEGFVRIAPYSGTFVADLDEREAEDLLRVRASLEVLCARQAADRRTDDHLEAMRATIERASAAISAARHQELVGLNARFHLLLAEASGNAVLHHLLAQLQAKIEWVYAADVETRAEASWTEHAWMVDALRARDADAAAAVATLHVANATAAYRRSAS